MPAASGSALALFPPSCRSSFPDLPLAPAGHQLGLPAPLPHLQRAGPGSHPFSISQVPVHSPDQLLLPLQHEPSCLSEVRQLGYELDGPALAGFLLRPQQSVQLRGGGSAGLQSRKLVVLALELSSQHLHEESHLRQLLLHQIARRSRSPASRRRHLPPPPPRPYLRSRRRSRLHAGLRSVDLGCSIGEGRANSRPLLHLTLDPLEVEDERVAQREEHREGVLLAARGGRRRQKLLIDADGTEGFSQSCARVSLDQALAEDPVDLLQEQERHVRC
eukprot:765435-Hanusia_phi.AAC.3